MSPRSEEFLDQARDRLAMAREVLASGHREGAVSAAYYSMLYAARAALSEDEDSARTQIPHRDRGDAGASRGGPGLSRLSPRPSPGCSKPRSTSTAPTATLAWTPSLR
jgi:hypothetical protein